MSFVGQAVISMNNSNELDTLDDQVDYEYRYVLDSAILDFELKRKISPFDCSPIPGIIISAVITGLWMYPLVGFIMEVRKGIMSRETYPREEYCCC